MDRGSWRTLVSAVMNLRVPWNAGNLLTSCKPVSCSGRTLHHGVSKEVYIYIYITHTHTHTVCVCVLYILHNMFSVCVYTHTHTHTVELNLSGLIGTESIPDDWIFRWKHATLAVCSSAVTIYSTRRRLNLSNSPHLQFHKPQLCTVLDPITGYFQGKIIL